MRYLFLLCIALTSCTNGLDKANKSAQSLLVKVTWIDGCISSVAKIHKDLNMFTEEYKQELIAFCKNGNQE